MKISRKMLPTACIGGWHTKESAMMVFRPAMAILAALHLTRRIVRLVPKSRGPEKCGPGIDGDRTARSKAAKAAIIWEPGA
jgi:hypothetical protein